MIRFHDHGFGVFTPQRGIPPCRWDRFDLLCLHRGCLQLTVEDDAPITLSPGMGMLIHPHTRFTGSVMHKACRVSVQHFAIEAPGRSPALPGVIARLAGRRHGCERVAFSEPARFLADVTRAMQLAFTPQSPQVHDQRVAMLVLILSQLQASPAIAHRGTSQAWEQFTPWLRARLHEPVTVHAMAGHMGMSTAHFIVRFKAIHRQTPARYFQRLRMSEAQRLLRETDLPIKHIAMKLGFNDLPNFYRTFKSAVTASPARYRQKHTLRG